MSPLTALKTRKKAPSRLSRNNKIFKTIIQAISEKKGERIISLDLRKIPEAVADFFIICEASSTIQVKAIAEFIEDSVKRNIGESPYQHEGYSTLKWVLVDYINIVVHVFHPETRDFYRLEEMWSDAEIMEHSN
ncbi:MAG: ribosome silencing factor [Chitinophagaceae bacterium]